MRVSTIPIWLIWAGFESSGQAYAHADVGLLAQCDEVIQFIDRKELDLKASPAIGLCTGMIEGVWKTMRSMNPQLPKEFQSCFPVKDITNEEVIRVVVKYMRENKLSGVDDATQAMFAIQDAYACG